MHFTRRRYSVADRLRQFGPAAERRLRSALEAAAFPYPPAADLGLVAFKDSKTLEVYARHSGERWRFVKTYPVLAASGEPGPKLREGDRQVPEGVYRVELLNPNSRFHVSLRLDYPNAFDRSMAESEGRTNLGGDIMIHGSAVSIGCLAMGDEAAEDLFVLAALVGKERVTVMICPTDLRLSPPVISNEKPGWVQTLYATLASELHAFKW